MALSKNQFLNLIHLKQRLERVLPTKSGVDRVVLLQAIDRLEKRLKYSEDYNSYLEGSVTGLRKAG